MECLLCLCGSFRGVSLIVVNFKVLQVYTCMRVFHVFQETFMYICIVTQEVNFSKIDDYALN